MSASGDRCVYFAVDVGSSSVRCSAYEYFSGESDGAQPKLRPLRKHNGDGSQVYATRPISLSREGTLDARVIEMAVDEVLLECTKYQISPGDRIDALGFSCLSMSLVGVDTEGKVVTPVFTYADSHESTHQYVRSLERTLGPSGVASAFQSTGAPLHAAYAAPQLLRAAVESASMLGKVTKWQTISSYLAARFAQVPWAPVSYSEASWTGMLNWRKLVWEDAIVAALPTLAVGEETSRKLPLSLITTNSLAACLLNRRSPSFEGAGYFLVLEMVQLQT